MEKSPEKPFESKRETLISPLLQPARELVSMKNAEGLIEPTEEQLRSTEPFNYVVDEEYERHMNIHTMTYWSRPTKYVDLVLSEFYRNKGIYEKVKEYFKNRPFVDLGAGVTSYGYFLAESLGSSGYVAVEPFFFKTISTELNRRIDDQRYKLPFSIVKEDAFSFLKRLADNSACVIASGLDRYIIRDKEYAAQVSDEISRVIGKDNAFLSYCSVFSASDVSRMKVDKEGDILLYKRNMKSGK